MVCVFEGMHCLDTTFSGARTGGKRRERVIKKNSEREITEERERERETKRDRTERREIEREREKERGERERVRYRRMKK